MPPPRSRKSDTEAVPLWSWGVLFALLAMSLGVWFPQMEHWRRQTMGWSLLAIILGWVVKFGNHVFGLILCSIAAMFILFGEIIFLLGDLEWPEIMSISVFFSFLDMTFTAIGGPLHMSAQIGQDSITKFLVDSGMYIDSKGLLVSSNS